MQTSVTEAKALLRQQVRASISQMGAEERKVASEQARELLQRQPVWNDAQSILFFAPTQDEPDLWPLTQTALAAGKQLLLPRFVSEDEGYIACHIKDFDKDLQVGRFGIREPSERCSELRLNRLDLILVPGLAFDLQGHRLGRGKGFYDQLLATVRGLTCGVAFEQQIVREIPVAPHDVHVNCILTPTRWIEW